MRDSRRGSPSPALPENVGRTYHFDGDMSIGAQKK